MFNATKFRTDTRRHRASRVASTSLAAFVRHNRPRRRQTIMTTAPRAA
jgi:hypothetical protein